MVLAVASVKRSGCIAISVPSKVSSSWMLRERSPDTTISPFLGAEEVNSVMGRVSIKAKSPFVLRTFSVVESMVRLSDKSFFKTPHRERFTEY